MLTAFYGEENIIQMMNKTNSSSHKLSTIINCIILLLFCNLQYDMERQLFSSQLCRTY